MRLTVQAKTLTPAVVFSRRQKERPLPVQEMQLATVVEGPLNRDAEHRRGRVRSCTKLQLFLDQEGLYQHEKCERLKLLDDSVRDLSAKLLKVEHYDTVRQHINSDLEIRFRGKIALVRILRRKEMLVEGVAGQLESREQRPSAYELRAFDVSGPKFTEKIGHERRKEHRNVVEPVLELR